MVEAGALSVFAVVLLVELFSGGSQSAGVSIFLMVCAAGAAWALVAAGRALARGSRGARGVIMTWQLFQILGGIAAVGSGVRWGVLAGVFALVLAVAVVVLLVSRPVTEATTGHGAGH
ncbi:hypothetical protein [Antribacter gilvus]|uniref:hypothetical protein n=1 Tax=Antribacter gilvus TaxID=2304675 RepID=UPI000F7A7F52|nr:hypothetical protein [Antribacter gilvus]